MTTLLEFKAAFKQYQSRDVQDPQIEERLTRELKELERQVQQNDTPELQEQLRQKWEELEDARALARTQKDPVVEQRLQKTLEDITEKRTAITKRLNGLKKLFDTRLKEVIKERLDVALKGPRSVSKQQLEGIENSATRELTEEKERLKPEIMRAFELVKTASDHLDFVEAGELVEELEAIVGSLGGGDRLARLLEQRERASAKVDGFLRNSPNKPSKEPDEDPKADPQAVRDVVKKATKQKATAQKWREDEIKGVEQARSELLKLEREFNLKRWLGEWLSELARQNQELRKPLATELEKLNQCRKELHKGEKNVRESQREIDETRNFIEENRDTQDEVLKPRVQRAPQYLHEQEEQQREYVRLVDDARLRLPGLKNLVSDAVAAVNDAVANAERELERQFNELVQKLQERNPDIRIVRPDVNVGEFRVALDLDSTDAIELNPPPNPKDMELDPDRMFPELERTANKHGTGRHGAQTGLEQQARRLATGGVTPDQPGHEWGTTRPTGNSVSWNTVLIEWEAGGKGRREIANERAVVRAILTETRHQAASSASIFLNPEVEVEAVQRVLSMVERECKWTEVEEDNGWRPLNRIVVNVGPPQATGAIGYGHEVARINPDSEKRQLEEVNGVLQEFREGKIDQDGLLKRLDVQLTQSREDSAGRSVKHGGAKIMPNCKVIVDRVGDKWINTSQYPCGKDNAPGWSLAGKNVRSENQIPEVAPQRLP